MFRISQSNQIVTQNNDTNGIITTAFDAKLGIQIVNSEIYL